MPLAGCAARYECGTLQIPLEGDVLAPYVRATFASGDGLTITVGNESSPPDNNAVIKSFDYGTSDGHKCTMEIVDQEGGRFQKFVDRVNKCIERTSADTNMLVQWGWVKSNCRGGSPVDPSPEIKMIPMNIEVDFSAGIIKYTITAIDGMQNVFNSREDQNIGSEGDEVPLTVAIRDFMQRDEPKFNVRFQKKNPDGTPSTLRWKEGGEQGPDGVWRCDNQNKLATCMAWIENYRTEDDKGVHPCLDNVSGDTIIFWEDLLPGCNEGRSCDGGLSLGTFIVNGGKMSPVISFSPNINWPAAFGIMASGGNSGASESGETRETTRKCNTQGDSESVGLSTSITVDSTCRNVHGPDRCVEESEISQNAHAKANSVNTEGLHPIEAELKFQGRPNSLFVDLKLIVGTNVGIVVINPFYIIGDDQYKDWLARPECNEVLSNKTWMVKGVNHSIKEGSYVTTLKVFLPTPGINIDAGQPLGGPGSGGYTPDGTC